VTALRNTISLPNLAAGVAYLLTLALTCAAFWGLISYQGSDLSISLLQDNYIQQILKFTLYQAVLSTLLSLLLAIPVARALHRASPWGKSLFLKLSLLAFVMPSLVLVSGIVNLLGPQSLFSKAFGGWNLFGLSGILIAHVYLNFPFAVRVLYGAFQAIPESREQLADQLKLSTWQRIQHIELPAIRAQLWTLAGLIGILCFNSFAIVLTLGGGPKATTLELAIYQALKYDFNLSEALTLAWLQFAIAGSLFLLLSYSAKVNWLGAERGTKSQRVETGLIRQLQLAIYAVAWGYLLFPILALVSKISVDLIINYPYSSMLKALSESLIIATTSALLAMLFSLVLLNPIRNAAMRQQKLTEAFWSWLASHSLVAPAMVISTGTYILLISQGVLEVYSYIYLILLNAMVLLPFLLNQLKPHLLQFDQQYRALIDNLKLPLLERLKVTAIHIHKPLIATASFALLLALGDIAIFAIFGSYQHPTLPWLIYTFAGTYRLAEAALTSLILLALCFVLLRIMEHYQRHD
jgi:thiamine transport system permease protein